ncbi:CarD family transcriptional regulator [Candidatus Oleimmundimicrobium sp.]|uniref:CarD family transcriptional regulator n=1 Tax=Candidatus Oleimmundimicrobium sp. TaxID=3060597 RepID=UPI0027197350|nr:CarD family transcriptional regulator [Candidatus Oleimmundimicrobium sp.]MDO8885998.1 CarD family transcriptional regulator [Candidatus Oleimmundimicrobium sp.]
MHKKGEKVFYPYHGIGIIEDVTTKKFNDEKKKYYVLLFSDENMKIMVPFEKADELGLRSVLSKKEIKEVLNVLKEKASKPKSKEEEGAFARSYYLDMVGSSSVFDVVEGVCDLLYKKESSKLSRVEDDLLKRGLCILSSLIMNTKQTSETKAKKLLIDSWEEGFAKKKKS